VTAPALAALAAAAIVPPEGEAIPPELEAVVKHACAGAWRAVEVVLAGEVLRGRLGRTRDTYVRDGASALLDLFGKIAVRPEALASLRAARDAGALGGELDIGAVVANVRASGAAAVARTAVASLRKALVEYRELEGVLVEPDIASLLVDTARAVFRHGSRGSELARWAIGPTGIPGRDQALAAFSELAHSPASIDELEALIALPIHLDENVQFTVYRPRTIDPGRWHPMLAFAHLAERRPDEADLLDPLEEVRRQAETVLGDRAKGYQPVTQDSRAAIPAEGELTFVPEITGIEFNPPRRSFLWLEAVHREEFRLRAGAELDGKTVRGRLTVFLGHIAIAEVGLTLRVDAARPEPTVREPAHARTYRKIFASYSHRDIAIVNQFEQYARALGDEYLRDWIHLRTGEVWNDRLRQLIENADAFQLFWSWNAMNSKFVKQEYEHALSLNRPSFVRPTYWETPMPTAPGLPPEALLRLHFQRIGGAVTEEPARAPAPSLSGPASRSVGRPGGSMPPPAKPRPAPPPATELDDPTAPHAALEESARAQRTKESSGPSERSTSGPSQYAKPSKTMMSDPGDERPTLDRERPALERERPALDESSTTPPGGERFVPPASERSTVGPSQYASAPTANKGVSDPGDERPTLRRERPSPAESSTEPPGGGRSIAPPASDRMVAERNRAAPGGSTPPASSAPASMRAPAPSPGASRPAPTPAPSAARASTPYVSPEPVGARIPPSEPTIDEDLEGIPSAGDSLGSLADPPPPASGWRPEPETAKHRVLAPKADRNIVDDDLPTPVTGIAVDSFDAITPARLRPDLDDAPEEASSSIDYESPSSNRRAEPRVSPEAGPISRHRAPTSPPPPVEDESTRPKRLSQLSRMNESAPASARPPRPTEAAPMPMPPFAPRPSESDLPPPMPTPSAPRPAAPPMAAQSAKPPRPAEAAPPPPTAPSPAPRPGPVAASHSPPAPSPVAAPAKQKKQAPAQQSPAQLANAAAQPPLPTTLPGHAPRPKVEPRPPTAPAFEQMPDSKDVAKLAQPTKSELAPVEGTPDIAPDPFGAVNPVTLGKAPEPKRPEAPPQSKLALALIALVLIVIGVLVGLYLTR
jgi:hypothetical protein